MSNEIFDLVVIGGGINGAGIAADAAMRGLRVMLAEADDLAGATSSASSKLIHGGLRYLEHYEFRLVREALAEREVLLAKAPHIIRPMRFVLPHVAGMRSRALIRAGLFLYDHLAARRTLGGSHAIDLGADPAGVPLASHLKHAFSYWDCAVDDARLVVLNAIAAREAGARIVTRTPVRALRVEDGLWIVLLGDGSRDVAARAVVNAAGPWVGDVARLGKSSGARSADVRLVRGSHIVVPRIAGADDAYTLQNSDGRVVFVLPFESDFTLIGTTEQPQGRDPRPATVSSDEESYLLTAVNRYLRVPLKPDQIVWTFAGVRPLDDDGSDNVSAITRDYRLDLQSEGTPPILNVIGGKITTYRKLAEAALDLLAQHIPGARSGSTRTAPLPGGDFGGCTFDAWFDDFARRHAGFERRTLMRLARRYGTRTARILDGTTSERDLGQDFGAGLCAREIAYLKSEEWADAAEDILWRRTKTGLHIAPGARASAAEAIQGYVDKL
ncbi:Glycerol-3-phosphate dehydrogenase [Hyphomicrobium denitrificans ATCC 51888]|uniref:Glycerol-3-phosphate dehydrogenase n=1 Tax=Hyphomicrobium denitrificans (strain ATCC 51888 / DSM 1869 / NCIMB 11706 / TK 0415) TaxID=582899 RepID=D8JYA4_HYPDA|nr:glycerol-3-phosphate dehydrogenase [Hyphomicrobium denitrificans]ADJ25308.1 Glycerol-3-phosphate dehydrogenase [Hyphomicrobium denitrificans ATCC 51888]